MTSQPNETARQDVATAIQMLRGAALMAHVTRDADGLLVGYVELQAIDAVRARLESALVKLDAAEPVLGWAAVPPEDRALLGQDVTEDGE